MKNTSLEGKDTPLISFIQGHFNGEYNLARVKLICLFIVALCKIKTINYDRLASGFDTKANKNSSYRRIQRFMKEFEFPMKIVSSLIFNLLPSKSNLILVLDRTNWKFGTKNINILMLGVSYKNVAFPLMFKMLDKRGNSDTQERITLIKLYIELFGKESIDCILADREFVGEKWLEFLNQNNIRYYIRIRNNFKIYSYQKQEEIKAFWLFNNLNIGEFYHYPKIVELHGQRCYLSGSKTINRNGKMEFLIIVSFNKPEQAMIYYKERWQIETLFRGLKSSGFNIEDTHVTDLERLEKLFSLTMIAFVWCYKVGDYLDENIQKIKIKKHGRRAVSVFKYGLDYLSKFLLTGFNSLENNMFSFLSCT
ncbi:Transposase DDE domain-containing protein [Flavobacterium micromati]|uniref:Transposase DDE domain-containing protein n=1 Tax=Flavobacterium micromati TaxID=229205 RepID=A0A1M5R9M8_9FLAO|nr:IS4 family transposase [Flavobacterium micromati]SHH23035.1 Transposase DDE domain-containing protein [Flavobacterium micromati]